VLDKINPTHKIFFTADVEAAFNSVHVSEATQRKLALWMPDGRVFFPSVMPFGAKNAPPTFARNIALALRSVQEVLAYFDDTHGGGADWMEMVRKLKETAEALQAHGFSLSFRKTHLGRTCPCSGSDERRRDCMRTLNGWRRFGIFRRLRTGRSSDRKSECCAG
jgi:hypothetical protein